MKQRQLSKIKFQLKHLTTSPLFQFRQENNYLPVVGEGSLEAKLMLIGEAPGRQEAQTGRPFCGVSGKRLTRILNAIDLKRQDVYITNIVNDRPPENRRPTQKEIKLYSPFLLKQIELIKPRAIVTLGATAVNFFVKKFKLEASKSMIRLREKEFELEFKFCRTVLIPTYHPSYLTYRPEKETLIKQDLKRALKAVGLIDLS